MQPVTRIRSWFPRRPTAFRARQPKVCRRSYLSPDGSPEPTPNGSGRMPCCVRRGSPDPAVPATEGLRRHRNFTTTMPWTNDILDRLSAQLPCGYHATGPASTEPTALAALALMSANRSAAAARPSLGSPNCKRPTAASARRHRSRHPAGRRAWPFWQRLLAQRNGSAVCTFDAHRGVAWILQTRGEALPRTPEMGHDTTLVGWPWIDETHSWIEPTAMHVLALKAAGHADHPRSPRGRPAADRSPVARRRLQLRQHCRHGSNAAPAFATDRADDARAGARTRSRRPHQEITRVSRRRVAVDHGCRVAVVRTAGSRRARSFAGHCAHTWLENAYRRTIARDGAPYRLALLALAALGAECPLVTLAT